MKHTALIAAAAAILIALSGCSSPEPPLPESVKVEPANETPETPKKPEKNERGNLVKTVGEPSALKNDAGEDLITFAVNGISVDPGCTGEFAEAPENGHFVILDVALQTSAEFEQYDFFIDSGAWKGIAPNGTTVNQSLATFPAFSCLTDAETLPIQIGPSENITGKVVLDLPTAEGLIVLNHFGGGGWEWVYPAA